MNNKWSLDDIYTAQTSCEEFNKIFGNCFSCADIIIIIVVFGMVFFRMILFGMVFFEMIFFGMVVFKMIFFGMVFFKMILFGMIFFELIF